MKLLSPEIESDEEDPEKKSNGIDVTAVRRTFLKRKEEFRRKRHAQLDGEPTSEEKSKALLNIQHIDLALIKIDPTFTNTRLHDDALRPELTSNEGQRSEDLEQSMKEEGLKVPIEVVEGPHCYFMVAGFRRRKVAIKLGWKKIPAIVYPANTPLRDEYWINILENSTRKSLTTYEIARAAQLMRDKFDVTAAEFARKTGYSSGFVSKLLTCIDKLPEHLLEHWQIGSGLSFDEWYHLSLMDHDSAMKRFWSLTGQRPKEILRDLIESQSNGKRLPPAWLSDRMMRLYQGIEGSELEPRVRDLVLAAVSICMCTRDTIKGVYEPRRQNEYLRRARLREELKLPSLPEPGEELKDAPPPTHQDSEEESEAD